MTQEQAILNYLQKGNTITALEALEKFGCMNLKGRIWDLKVRGHKIEKQMIKVHSGKTVAEYRLES